MRPATEKIQRRLRTDLDALLGPAQRKSHRNALHGLLVAWPIPDERTRWAIPSIKTGVDLARK